MKMNKLFMKGVLIAAIIVLSAAVLFGISTGNVVSYLEKIKTLGFNEIWIKEDTSRPPVSTAALGPGAAVTESTQNGSGGSAGSGSSSSSDVRAAATLLKALSSNDAAETEKSLAALTPAVLVELTKSSSFPGGDFSYDLNDIRDGIVITKYSGSGGVVVIPATIENFPVVEIGNAAFEGMSAITAVVIHTGVKKIGRDTFIHCKNLATVILPDGLEEIESRTFAGCSKLHTVNIPAGIKTVGDNAFAGCENLYNLSISNSITSITWEKHDDYQGTGAVMIYPQFAGCGKLKLATRQKLIDLGYLGGFTGDDEVNQSVVIFSNDFIIY